MCFLFFFSLPLVSLFFIFVTPAWEWLFGWGARRCGSPGCTLQIHKPASSCPDPSKWPCQAAISRDLLLQYRRIKAAFYDAFSQPKVCAIAACAPFSLTRVDLPLLDGILHPIWTTHFTTKRCFTASSFLFLSFFCASTLRAQQREQRQSPFQQIVKIPVNYAQREFCKTGPDCATVDWILLLKLLFIDA